MDKVTSTFLNNKSNFDPWKSNQWTAENLWDLTLLSVARDKFWIAKCWWKKEDIDVCEEKSGKMKWLMALLQNLNLKIK